MRLQDILEPDELVGPEYDVVQPSILAAIGKKNTLRRATVIKDYAMTVTCRQDRTPTQVVQRPDGRFRFLTPRECWRLQGMSDTDFEAAEKANPASGKLNRTLYQQAGNTMPVPVLEAIFKQLLG